MGIGPSPSYASGNIAAHRIMAEPTMSSTNSVSRVKLIRLTATCPVDIAKRWFTSFERLSVSLTNILGKATTAELLACLRVGQVMQLPGTYNPYEIARMGYRKTFEPTAGLKRKAGAR